MKDLDPAPRALAVKLGLGDLNYPPICHSRACGCVCADCVKLDANIAPQFLAWLENGDELAPMPRMWKRGPRPAPQPWDVPRAA